MSAQRITITTPFATPERSAGVLGVSKKRATKLIKWARSSASRIATDSTVTSGRKSKDEKKRTKKTAK